MKITSVRSFLLSYPLPEPLKLEFHGGERTIVKRDAMLIRVGTDKGLIGYAPGPGSAAQRIAEVACRKPYTGSNWTDEFMSLLFARCLDNRVGLTYAHGNTAPYPACGRSAIDEGWVQAHIGIRPMGGSL